MNKNVYDVVCVELEGNIGEDSNTFFLNAQSKEEYQALVKRIYDVDDYDPFIVIESDSAEFVADFIANGTKDIDYIKATKYHHQLQTPQSDLNWAVVIFLKYMEFCGIEATETRFHSYDEYFLPLIMGEKSLSDVVYSAKIINKNTGKFIKMSNKQKLKLLKL